MHPANAPGAQQSQGTAVLPGQHTGGRSAGGGSAQRSDVLGIYNGQKSAGGAVKQGDDSLIGAVFLGLGSRKDNGLDAADFLLLVIRCHEGKCVSLFLGHHAPLEHGGFPGGNIPECFFHGVNTGFHGEKLFRVFLSNDQSLVHGGSPLSFG